MRRVSFALALIAVLGFGGLLIESASAQNSNSSTTMGPHHMAKSHGRRRHRKQRKHRRHRRHNMNKMMNGNANH